MRRLIGLGVMFGCADVVEMDCKDDEKSDCESSRQREVPPGEPRPARDNSSRKGGFFYKLRLSKVGDCAAVGANCQMSEHLLLLMRRQSMLDKGVELVCVGMLAGLEDLGHWLSGTTGLVLSENATD
jgi:hypothetical protein